MLPHRGGPPCCWHRRAAAAGSTGDRRGPPCPGGHAAIRSHQDSPPSRWRRRAADRVWLRGGRSGTIKCVDSVTESTEDGSAAPVTERSADLEAVLMGAVDLARAAIVEHSGETVGDYLGATFDDSTAATHRFLANQTGYQGWQWAVVVAAPPGADHATISEVVLVPGPTALLAPTWVPWDERVRPGDLGPGDLLAAPTEDPRLVPGFAATGDPAIDDVAYELGLGRRRLLSQFGSARRRPAVARRRLRSRVGDGQVHPQDVPGLRLLCAGFRGPRADVRRLRQRVVGRRPRGRRRIRVRRTFGHPCAPGIRLTAVPPIRRRGRRGGRVTAAADDEPPRPPPRKSRPRPRAEDEPPAPAAEDEPPAPSDEQPGDEPDQDPT